MADSYTASLRIVQMPTGSNDTIWGVKADAAWAMLEEAIAGTSSISATSGNVTLTTANNATDQARKAVLVFTGTPGTTRTITMPNVSKLTWVKNDSDSPLVFTAGAGATTTVAAGHKTIIFTDGATNAASLLNAVDLASSDVSGILPVANGGTGGATAAAARTALGLGTSAVKDTGTSGANVPLLNGANTWSATQTFASVVGVGSVNYVSDPSAAALGGSFTFAFRSSNSQNMDAAVFVQEYFDKAAITAFHTATNATGDLFVGWTYGVKKFHVTAAGALTATSLSVGSNTVGTMAFRDVTVSTSDPSGTPATGAIWLKREA